MIKTFESVAEFNLNPGESVVITGDVGCGKTATILTTIKYVIENNDPADIYPMTIIMDDPVAIEKLEAILANVPPEDRKRITVLNPTFNLDVLFKNIGIRSKIVFVDAAFSNQSVTSAVQRAKLHALLRIQCFVITETLQGFESSRTREPREPGYLKVNFTKINRTLTYLGNHTDIENME